MRANIRMFLEINILQILYKTLDTIDFLWYNIGIATICVEQCL